MKDNNNRDLKWAAIAFIFIMMSVVLINSVVFSGKSVNYTPKIARSILKNIEIGRTISKNETKSDEKSELDEDSDDSASAAYLRRQKSKGGVLIERSSGRVLLDEGMNERCYPASTTKILTALIALESLDINAIVTIPKQAAGVEGSSIYLKAGQKISVLDLLYGMMLRSGNDAATALAIETAGSVEAFAELMNKKARSLGANDSNFVNPHGLNHEEHYTTAHDLALITAAAYENATFRQIVSSKLASITIDGSAVSIANKNKMLKLYEGANGVKTGYTTNSGRCLVSAAERDGMQLICVVLNYDDMWNDSIRMLDYGFDNFVMRPLELVALMSGGKPVEVKISGNYPLREDYSDIMYPLRRDGSEYVVIERGE